VLVLVLHPDAVGQVQVGEPVAELGEHLQGVGPRHRRVGEIQRDVREIVVDRIPVG
jgi:hypothetical protein